MLKNYLITAFRNLKRHKLYSAINIIGLAIGFAVSLVITFYLIHDLTFDRFHDNAENIYRINSGGYGVTPLCFGEKLKNQIPEISEVIRFSAGSIAVVENKEEVNIDKIYYTDKDIFKVFLFNIISGNIEYALKDPFSIGIIVGNTNLGSTHGRSKTH